MPTTPYEPRVTTPSPLFDSYTGTSAEVIGVLFSRAADQLEQHGFSHYSASEDPQVTGLSLWDALDRVISEHLQTVRKGQALEPDQHDHDKLREEMELRLAGALYVSGALRGRPHGDLEGELFSWVRNPVYFFGDSTSNRAGYYRNGADVIRLLKVAAVMVTTVDTYK